MHAIIQSRPVYPFMSKPRPCVTLSSSQVISASSSCGIQSSFASAICPSSSQPARYSSTPSSGSTQSSSANISKQQNGGNSTDNNSDTAIQPPKEAYAQRKDPPNIGKLDDLGRLIIISDGGEFYPSTQSTKAVV